MTDSRKKICIVATTSYPLLVFMKPHIAMFAEKYDVTLVAKADFNDLALILNSNVKFINVKISRKVSLLQDIASWVALYIIFKKERFEVVHSLMPKTSLLGVTAAYAARVPKRIHTFTGQVWANKKGVARICLKLFDLIVAKFATGLLTDSFSQRRFLIQQNIVKEEKIIVLGNGSVCGVDIKRFKPCHEARAKIRKELNLPDNAIIYIFLGRLSIDKGILDLVNAFAEIALAKPNAYLLIVGPDEENLSKHIKILLSNVSSQYRFVSFVTNPEHFMACADIFCLPSYREGFGSVLIEAAAVGLPVIASNIYGITDALIKNVTGLIHEPKNVEDLKRAMLVLLNQPELRYKMGTAGQQRAVEFFNTSILVNEMASYYKNLLTEK